MKIILLISGIILLISNTVVLAQTHDWQWTMQAGGDDDDNGKALALDYAGNSYVTGRFKDTATFGSYSLTSSGQYDVFVAKMDVNGNWLWATQAGGNNGDSGEAIAIDSNGNSYVVGRFNSSATFGSYSITSNGSQDIFVAKIDTNGNWLWAVEAGGYLYDKGCGIGIDDYGNSYVTGYFENTATFGIHSLTSNGMQDIFVAKIDADGNWLWATQAGGSDNDYGKAIVLDSYGYCYMIGNFKSTATFGSYSITSIGQIDFFIAKMDSDGNWIWATQAGGNDYDYGEDIALDDNGNSYVTGKFRGTTNIGSYSFTSNGEYDIFAAKIDGNGNWLWAIEAGGGYYDFGNAIAIDDIGNSYVTGHFSEIVTFGSYSLTSYGIQDILLAKIDTSGSWVWATQAGGNNFDTGTGIELDDSGTCYITGYFEDTATFGSYALTSNGNFDIFIASAGSNSSTDNELILINLDFSNHPNPFNPTTTISFSIQEDTEIELSIYNIKGQKIRSLLNNQITAGEHSVIWNGKDDSEKKVASGIYLYKLNINGKTEAVKKCLLLK